MLFSVHAIDRPDISAKRQAVHGAHIAHLKAAKDFGVTIVTGGPLIADDGKDSIGSLMLLEAPDRKTVEAFNRADPFANGIWASVQINRFDKKQG